MTPIIQVSNLVKTFKVAERQQGVLGTMRHLFAPNYQTIRAVDDISFSLEKGEIIGYLGPNGAGKSTTLKVLTGLLVPTRGEVIVDGQVPWEERTKYVAGIGAVFGQRTTLWWDLPVIDSFELIGSMYKVPPVRFRRNLDDFTQLLEMSPFMDSPVRSLSLGQRMRADLCAALLHEPRLLFLDEPTIGLDVVARERIRQFIRHIHQERKTTIILTTHDLSDIERLCERVIIIDHGKLFYDGELSTLVERYDTSRLLEVTFAQHYEQVDLPDLPCLERSRRRATYAFDKNVMSASEIIPRLNQRFNMIDLEVRRPELEAIIRRIYEENSHFEATDNE